MRSKIFFMKINLFTTYFKSESADRQKELDNCLTQNLRNPYINKVNIFLDQNTRSSDFYRFFEEPDDIYANKLNFIKIDRIPTYKDWIEYSIKDNSISIFANADIYFDDSINKIINYLTKPNQIVCLSRNEDFEEFIVPHPSPHWSQDVWAINFEEENNLDFIEKLNIPTGKYRCDNKLAYFFSVNGWDLYNPFTEIKCYHKHATKLRTYDTADTAIIGTLAFVSPIDNPEVPSVVEYHIMPIKTANIKKNVSVGSWLEKQINNKNKIVITVPLDERYYRGENAFYELVMAWKERGYVEVEFSKESSHFWINGKNNILLFDKDNLLYLSDMKKDPPRWDGDVKYKYGFFANQYHLENDSNFKMTYWSLSPKKLESIRKNGRKIFQHRKYDSVFIGSIENETQEYFRNFYKDWESEIDQYHCSDKLNKKESQKYDFEQYANIVGQSKFGICFRGNGPKCYREIEYLALGTPLITTKEVETDYPDSLIEGKHYFLANSKEDINLIVRNTSKEKWEEMSVACWDWFERNATIDSTFNYVKEKIETLDLRSYSHSKISINCQNESTDSIAYKSIKIFNPEIKIVFNEERTISVDADDLIINKIPYVGNENAYVWKIKNTEINSYVEKIHNSSLNYEKNLLVVLGERFLNHKVLIKNNGLDSLCLGRINNNELVLTDGEIAKIETDFDFYRRCNIKYNHIEKTIVGPSKFKIPVIKATLNYKKNKIDLQYDLSKCFADYYAVCETLIPRDYAYNICKLWQFENCELDFICGSIDEDKFLYSNLKYNK